MVLTPRSQVAQLGDPVFVQLEIRNVSSANTDLVAPQVACNYQIVVINTATRKILPQHPAEEGCDVYSSGGMHVVQGTSWFMTIRLSNYISLNEPGTYRVQIMGIRTYVTDYQIRSIPLRSNTVVVRLVTGH